MKILEFQKGQQDHPRGALQIAVGRSFVREKFVGMYFELVMANFFVEFLKSSPVALPSLPTPGSLDIRQVLESSYFFA